MAITICPSSSNATSRVQKPSSIPAAPTTSANIPTTASEYGRSIPVGPVHFANWTFQPGPPNHPSVFWLPWTQNTAVSTNRSTVGAKLLIVARRR